MTYPAVVSPISNGWSLNILESFMKELTIKKTLNIIENISTKNLEINFLVKAPKLNALIKMPNIKLKIAKYSRTVRQ